MTEAAETAATETPPGAQSSEAGAGTIVERPEFIPEKFWDGEAKAPRVEDLARSYGDLEKLIGSRVHDLGTEARRKLAAALPDELKSTWAEEHRTALAADPEFLTPLEEAWKGKHLPKAPEAYETPTREDGAAYDAEHPLYSTAMELAKKYALPQEAFNGLLDLTYQARADYETPPDLAEWKAAIPDIEPRAKAVYNRLRGVAGDHAGTLINQVRDPNAFLALEAIVKASGPKSLALEAGQAEPEITAEKLDEMMRDPRYWRDHDRDFHAKVTNGFKRLHGDTL